jgi:hypothetical protein
MNRFFSGFVEINQNLMVCSTISRYTSVTEKGMSAANKRYLIFLANEAISTGLKPFTTLNSLNFYF